MKGTDMSKKMHAKKPQDATLRNVRAANKRHVTLEELVSQLEAQVKALSARSGEWITRVTGRG